MGKNIVIDIKDLTKMYGDVVGIKNLDLKVYDGEIMGFLGPNGSGKTTTIRTCLGLLKKTGGDVKIFGHDSHKDRVEICRRTGYLPGDFGFFPDLKVRKVLEYLLSLSGVKSRERMLYLSERFELELDRKVKELSKGNRQKIGIVQAFMADQELVMLDEPTSGLDPLMQQEFYDFIKEENRTVFMSSHILAEVEAVCNRVAIIRKGELQVVENIRTLQKKMGKVLDVEFTDTVDPTEFRMEGVNEIEVDGDSIRMVVTDNLDDIIKKVSEYKIVNLNLETFSLDQLFLRYYSEEGDSSER